MRYMAAIGFYLTTKIPNTKFSFNKNAFTKNSELVFG